MADTERQERQATRREEGDAADEDKSAAFSRRRRLLLTAAGGALVSVLGIVLLIFSRPEPPPPATPPPEPAEVEIDDPDGVLTGAVVRLDELVVNLGDAQTFFKLRIALEFFDFAPPEQWERKLPRVKDAVLKTVSRKKPAELLTPRGKELLRAELIDALNESLSAEDDEVVDVYFLSYLVQESGSP